MKLKIFTNAEAIKDVGNSSFIGDNGVYDVTLNFVSIESTKNGAKKVNFNVTYAGNTQVIYGPTVANKPTTEAEIEADQGPINAIGYSIINKLAVIAGVSDDDGLNVETETHKVGKDNEAKDFNVITDFSGLAVKLRIQREYTLYNSKVQRDLVIRNVFREDGASASEIVNATEAGKQLALEIEKYSTQSSYRDGVTPEQAADYEEAQKAGKKSAGAAPVSQVTAKRSGMFKPAV